MPEGVQRFFVVPHTHWDREWYRPVEHFRLLLAGVVDGVLDTLERDSSFTSFTLDGQAIVLEDYLDARPENEARLRALISDGRIEVGPSYVLPDEFLVGAEPLVRNLLIGRAVCERFGARPSPAGYLPDSFGHPLQLPQILAGFGIDTFLFSRGLGDELDDLGVVFDWVAPDGSAVRAVQLLPDYSNFADIRDADDAQARVNGLLEGFGPALARGGVRDVVLCNGTDHRPIQPHMPAVCAELAARCPGLSFQIAQFGDYVEAMRTDALPSWTGELLGSRLFNVLRGVNSARLYLKQANERAEQRLLSVETLASLSALRTGTPFPRQNFDLAWRDLLTCHPHDSICGCSCDEVHRDMLVRYASLHRTLDLLTDEAAAGLSAPDRAGAVGVVNPLPFARSALLCVEGSAPTPVALDGFEGRTVQLVPASDRIARAGNRIESERFSVQARPDGTLVVEDRATGRRFEGLHALEDERDVGDLYNFCPVEGAGVWRCRDARARVLSDRELEIAYHGELPAGAEAESGTVALGVTTIVRLHDAAGRIEFETTIDNAARDHRLRVIFPVGERAARVRAEGHFAVVRRGLGALEPRTQWCEPPDPTQHSIGAVALGPLALLTRGLPEHEARDGVNGAELCLTMLRCVGLISRATGEIPTRPLGAGPRMATPEGQCLGRHVLEYSLRLDAANLDDVGLLRASQDYRAPVLVVAHPVELQPPLTLEGDVVFSCLKGAQDDDGFILRVFNPAGEPARARVGGPVTVQRVRLDESGGERVDDGVVEVGAGEVVSLRLSPGA